VFFRSIGTGPTGGWTAKTQLGTGEGESAVPAGPEVDVDFPDMGPQWATFAGSDYTTSLSLQWAHDNSPFRTVFVYHGTDEAGIATSLDPSLGARDVSIRESLTQNGSCSIGIKTHVAFALIVPSTSDPKLGGIVVAPPVIKA